MFSFTLSSKWQKESLKKTNKLKFLTVFFGIRMRNGPECKRKENQPDPFKKTN